jgi:CRP/FNR family putative post-exponential-phase nitrogen-starvation transcriptional regulator
MKRISDRSLLNHYIEKYRLDGFFGHEILSRAFLAFYIKDEFVMEAQSELQYYYLLVDGKVKISYPFENGKSMFLKFYQDFNVLGDLEFLKNIPVLCNVEAIRDSYFILVPADVLRRESMENVEFLRHLVESLSNKLYATINNSSYNYIYPLVNRLSSYLLEHINDSNAIAMTSSYEEIAQFLGTTYRHLNRTLKEMERRAVIRCENKTIHILDRESLEALSKNVYIQQ